MAKKKAPARAPGDHHPSPYAHGVSMKLTGLKSLGKPARTAPGAPEEPDPNAPPTTAVHVHVHAHTRAKPRAKAQSHKKKAKP